MDFAFIQHTIAVMPPFARWAWVAVLLACLATMGLIQFWERRHFARLGKAGSWASLRLILLIIIPLTAGVLIVPARAISGPEALAYFYGALFTVAPLTWFGLHALCGRWLRPALSKGESLFLAASALFVPVIGLSLAQGPIFMATRSIEASSYQNAPRMSLAHVAVAPRRFELPDGEVIFTQNLMAADALAAAPAELFAIGFREDGIDPPAPIPRSRTSLGYLRPDGGFHFRSLDMLQPGESFDDNCLMRGYRRVDWQREGAIQKVALYFTLNGQPPLRAEIERPPTN